MSAEVGSTTLSPEMARAGATRAAPAPPARGRRRPIVPYALLAPTVVFLAVFFLWPMLQALVLAFQEADGTWSVAPFERMTGDIRFLDAIKITLLFAGVVIPLQTVLALCMALLLMANLRFAGVFLYVWAIPLGLSDLASGVVWLSIFTDRGYLNSLLAGLGLSETGFPFLSFEHPLSLFLCAAVAEVWRATSIVMVILLSGLQVIPKDYAEAAEVFGATFWQRVRLVTLPLLRPIVAVLVVFSTIWDFKIFDQIYVMAQGVPDRAADTAAVTAYRESFALGNYGVGAAIAMR